MTDDDQRWRDLLAAYRRHQDPATAGDRACAAEVATLAVALLELGARCARRRGSAAYALCQRPSGATRWEEACDRRVFGAEDDARPLRSLMAAMAELDATGGLEDPRAYAAMAFHNLALSELRRARFVDVASVDGGRPGSQSAAALESWSAAVASVSTDLVPSVHPTALPAALAAALRQAARLGRVFAEAVRHADVGAWDGAAGHLERDVALGPQRRRWPEGDDTLDNHSCAWQAAYHDDEGHSDYLAVGEVPLAAAPSRGRFDQHVSRFRRLWATVSTGGAAVVEAAAGELVEGLGRVPLAWDAPDHPTLRGRPAPKGGR